MSLPVAATPPKAVLIYSDFRLIQNTDVIWTTKVKLTRAKWTGSTEHSFLQTVCGAHFEQTCFEQSLHSQFSVAYMVMLLPDAIPTIFPISKKAGKAPTKKRDVFKSEKDSG